MGILLKTEVEKQFSHEFIINIRLQSNFNIDFGPFSWRHGEADAAASKSSLVCLVFDTQFRPVLIKIREPLSKTLTKGKPIFEI